MSENSSGKFSKKIGEMVATDVYNYGKRQIAKVAVQSGKKFNYYLKNAGERYNQIKTPATGPNPRTIIDIGNHDSIYVNLSLNFNSYEGRCATVKDRQDIIINPNVESLLSVSNNVLIMGTGGMGKSMFMRYLFLDAADNSEYIPILVLLKRVDAHDISVITGENFFPDLLYDTMREFDANLNREVFDYGLRDGCFIFLMDGLDEIGYDKFKTTADSIQRFCTKYSKNPCILTSRDRNHTTHILHLETFVCAHILPLDKSKAIELAQKLGANDGDSTEFCIQLQNGLYEQYDDFAGNPLLLSMMYVLFERNHSIPDSLSDFFQQVYEALYFSHYHYDNQRHFKCVNIDFSTFESVLSRFSFQTLFEEVRLFDKKKLLLRLQDNIDYFNMNASAEDYLSDLYNSICMLIREGVLYKFSHNYFQDFFAANYTASMSDEKQKMFFSALLRKYEYSRHYTYFYFLNQIEQDRFLLNALQASLQKTIDEAKTSPDCYLYLCKVFLYGVYAYPQSSYYIIEWSDSGDYSPSRRNNCLNPTMTWQHNCVALFRHFFVSSLLTSYEKRSQLRTDDENLRFFKTEFEKLGLDIEDYLHGKPDENEWYYNFSEAHGVISYDSFFRKIESSQVSNQDRERLYNLLLQIFNIKPTFDAIVTWLFESSNIKKQTDFDYCIQNF